MNYLRGFINARSISSGTDFFLQCFVLADTEFVIQDYFNFFYSRTDLKIKDHSFPFQILVTGYYCSSLSAKSE